MADNEENQAGRPSPYCPEAYPKSVAKLCELGATDMEIADFFGVDVRTIYRWKLAHEEFCQAMSVGKEHADERVKRSLYQRATGYSYVQKKAIKLKAPEGGEKVEIIDLECHVAADAAAAFNWLKNRDRDNWSDRQGVDVTSGGEKIAMPATIILKAHGDSDD